MDTIIVALIGAVSSLLGVYIVVKLGRQDKTLNQIEINVNHRLDALLDQSRLDNQELGKLRPEEPLPPAG